LINTNDMHLIIFTMVEQFIFYGPASKVQGDSAVQFMNMKI